MTVNEIETAMSDNLENFRSWFVRVLEGLYPQPEAGFAIVMIAFPLLERYLRLKVNLAPNVVLNDSFFRELIRLFPQLDTPDTKIARDFWSVYRNGALHQVTFSSETKNRRPLPAGAFSGVPGLYVAPDGGFFLHPADFAKRVTQEIEADFATLEGAASGAPPLATPGAIPLDAAVLQTVPVLSIHATTAPQAGLGGYIWGTSAKPSEIDGVAVGSLACSVS